MAVLAAALQDGRDIPGEGDLRLRGRLLGLHGRRRHEPRHAGDEQRGPGDENPAEMLSNRHESLLERELRPPSFFQKPNYRGLSRVFERAVPRSGRASAVFLYAVVSLKVAAFRGNSGTVAHPSDKMSAFKADPCILTSKK